MPENYFVCNPGVLCQGAQCCTSLETQPSIGIGDYLRLSEHTGETALEIWRTKGDVALSNFDDMKHGEFMISLSLLHNPCPYLTSDFKCGVYESRPLGCGDFPFNLIKHNADKVATIYRDYSCVQNVVLSPRQENFLIEMNKIMRDEAFLDHELFWHGEPPHVHTSTIGSYFQMAGEAEDMQRKRDMDCKTTRSIKLATTIRKALDLAEHDEFHKLSTDAYTALLRPVVYVIYEDDIAERLENLSPDTIALYGDTSRRWKSLRSSP